MTVYVWLAQFSQAMQHVRENGTWPSAEMEFLRASLVGIYLEKIKAQAMFYLGHAKTSASQAALRLRS